MPKSKPLLRRFSRLSVAVTSAAMVVLLLPHVASAFLDAKRSIERSPSGASAMRQSLSTVQSAAGTQHALFVRHSRIISAFPLEAEHPLSFVADLVKTSLLPLPLSVPDYRIDTIERRVADGVTGVRVEPMFFFQGVGFPHIETSSRPDTQRYKPYRKLVKVRHFDDGTRLVIPNVACHGYSSERTHKIAARYVPLIDRYAERYSISADIVKAVIAQESCFRSHAVSPAGARGLMQLMPETAAWLGVKDVTNDAQNLRAGIRYLAQLTRRFGSLELALAAYNAGPGNVERYQGIPPFPETESYVQKVLQHYRSYSASRRLNQ